MKTCFIVSPIGDENSPVRKRADKLFKHIISPVCKECDFEAIRIDHENKSDVITESILAYLNRAELVIADISDQNPNVFYEIGYRSSTKKPIIHIKEKEQKIPFDISGIRAFDYDLSDLDAVEEIKERLKQTIVSYKFEENQLIENKLDDYTSSIDATKGLSQVFPILYSIQDKLTSLEESIRSKDTETIQTIIKASQSAAPVEDQNIALMKILVPEIIRNPAGISTLIKLTEYVNNRKNDNPAE